MKLVYRILPFLLIGIITIACSDSTQPVDSDAFVQSEPPKTSPAETPIKVLLTTAPTVTVSPDQGKTETLVITASSTSTPTPEPAVCSPLADVPIDELAGHISNQFNPPRLGSDDAHQGVDLAILSDPDQYALAGAPVNAMLGGRAAGVIQGMFPYGNAVLVETPLEFLPPGILQSGYIPTVAPTLPPHPSLTCPQTGEYPNWDSNERSIYILYAHMQEPPSIKTGDRVLCGDKLGTVGKTGNALHPHLHLEVRVGPSGASISGMAHYDTRATPQEMEAYCIWRVSGIFQLLDPFHLLTPQVANDN